MATVNDVNTFSQLGLTGSSRVNDSSGSLGQEDFLQLMITQIQNQDPFKPMESGDFLAQLASFGTVDGIGNVEKTLQDLSSSLSSNQALQASSLLDRDVRFASDYGALNEGESLDGAVELGHSATQVVVGIYSGTGELVRRLDLGAQQAGQAGFSWDGRTESGASAAPGVYEIRAEAISGQSSEAATVLVDARVQNVTLGGLGEPLTIGIQGLGDVNFSRVRQIG